MTSHQQQQQQRVVSLRRCVAAVCLVSPVVLLMVTLRHLKSCKRLSNSLDNSVFCFLTGEICF